MKILGETLDQFAQEIQNKRAHPTLIILRYNGQIGREFIQAAEKKQVAEYLGMKLEDRGEGE